MIASLPLHQLPIGQSAEVRELTCTGDIRRRLMDLGLIRGITVAAVQKSPSGEMTAYRIRGAVFAIRDRNAKDVLVTLI